MPKHRTIKAGRAARADTAVVNMAEDEGHHVVIDATGLVAGRLASNVAKRLMSGERVEVVNAEHALITGSREAVFREFREKKVRGTTRKGPFYPRMPHLILKRIIRGMVPYQRGNGHAAYRRLRVHIGVPEEMKATPQTIENAKTRAAQAVSVGEIAKNLGAKF